MFEWGFGMTVGVLSFVKLKVRGVLAVFIFIFSPLWRASPFCLPELRSGQARPARHEAASAPASRPATQTLFEGDEKLTDQIWNKTKDYCQSQGCLIFSNMWNVDRVV